MVKYFSWSTELTCFNPRNVTKRLGKIGDKYGKIRSCSLGQRGVSASLLDLQDKNITFNENVNDLVQTSIKSLRKFTSSGITLPLVTPVWYKLVSADEAEVVSLSQTSFAACSMTSKVTLHDGTSQCSQHSAGRPRDAAADPPDEPGQLPAQLRLVRLPARIRDQDQAQVTQKVHPPCEI